MERRTSSRRGSQSDQRSAGLQSSFDANPEDWCNSFWDANGAGYDAVLTRLKNGSRTLEDLRNFYNARSAIEEDYAKKLAKLSRQYLGRDETGSMRMALDRVRLEVANTADAHEKLGVMFRSALENKTKEFQGQREAKKANHQGAVEKLYKAKLDQEKLALKAKEKYKNDCVSINGLTAQTSLTQGRDLDKVSAKLDKANQTVQINKKEYEVFSYALKETNTKWTLEWKGFCDLAQDLEEERLNYMRISLWDYANGASFICVTDDESCENIRRALEACNAPGDLKQFVQERGTGAKIYDVPAFVDYERGDHGDGRKPTFRTASFARSSAKTEIISTGQALQDLAHALKPGQQMPQTGPSQPPTPSTEQPSRGRSDSQPAQQRGRSHSRPASTHSGKEQYASAPRSATPNPEPQRESSVKTAPPSPAQQIAQAYAEEQERRHSRQNSTISHTPNNDVSPLGERTQTQIPAPFQPTAPLERRQSKASLAPSRQEEPRNRYSSGSIAASYRSNQQQKLDQPRESRSRKNSSASQRVPSPRAEEEPPSQTQASVPPLAPKEEKAAEKDELAALLADLRDPSKAPERPKPFGGVKLPGMESKPAPSNRSAYNASPAPSNTSDMRRNEVQQHGYRQSYDAGRGQSPAPSQQQDFRRASSPAPSAQRASYQAPASPAASNRYNQQPPASPAPSNRFSGAPSSPAPVAAMMRPSQNAPSRDPAVATYGQALPGEHRMARPASQQSFHPSINEQRGRQDPYPGQQSYAPSAGVRSPSPAPYAGTAPASYGQQGAYSYQQQPQQPPPQQFQPPPRSTSPRPPSLHSNYGTRPVSPAPNQYAQPNHAARPVSPAPAQQYSTRPVSPAPAQMPYQQAYGQPPAMSHAPSSQSVSQQAQGRPPSLYQQQQRSSTPAGMNDYASNPAYGQPAAQQSNRQSAGYRHGAQVYGQQAATPAQQYAQQQGYQQPYQQPQQPYRSPSVVSMGTAQQQQQQQPYYNQAARAPSPQPQAARAPSPAIQNGMSGPTTGANAGRPVLFFVRAIYDYVATVPEEFSFQEDDVIAVFATDPDGWWQGELLDENRRGGNIFPSNFCTLLE